MGWKALSSLSFADVVSMCCLFYACEMTVIQEKNVRQNKNTCKSDNEHQQFQKYLDPPT